jgi:hypothetical protein
MAVMMKTLSLMEAKNIYLMRYSLLKRMLATQTLVLNLKGKSKADQALGFALDVEKIKDVMGELWKFWKCPSGKHPTICIPQVDHGGACKTFSISSIQKWAKLVVHAYDIIYIDN